MKRCIAIILLTTLLILIGNYSGNIAKASDRLSVKLVGCAEKPYANQTIQLQEIPCPKPDNCKWQTIKSYTTDSNGYVYVDLDGEPKIELDKHLYRFYWQKSRWVNSWVAVSNDQRDYIIGYGIDDINRKAENLNKRVYEVAIKEYDWSDAHRRNLVAQADKINDKQVLIDKILELMRVWKDSDLEVWKKALYKVDIERLRDWYIIIKGDIDNWQRYSGQKGYHFWCTAFSTYVLRKAGGPNPGTWRAATLYDWFKKPGDVRGLDNEMYRRTFLSDKNLRDNFNQTTTIPIQQGDFFLEKAIGYHFSGHSAIAYDVDGFPLVFFIAAGLESVTTYPHDYEEKSGSGFYFASGTLNCVQNP